MINRKLEEIEAKLETIKVLVQDNEYLSKVEKSCEIVNIRNEALEDRIQKVIEYIEEKDLTNNMNFMDDGIGNLFKDILEILKGGNND